MSDATQAPGKLAGVTDALKGQPLLYALVVMNLALLAYLFYLTRSYEEARATNAITISTMQRETALMLSKCVIPPDAPQQFGGRPIAPPVPIPPLTPQQ